MLLRFLAEADQALAIEVGHSKLTELLLERIQRERLGAARGPANLLKRGEMQVDRIAERGRFLSRA